jgi:hypothetical protein
VPGRGTRFGIDGAIRNILLRLLVAADNAAMPTEPSKADPPNHRRRWFQFSLRTLMIGVTMLAIPLGYVSWQAKIVSERKAALERILADRRFFVRPTSDICDDGSLNKSIPRLRWMMGDTWIDSVRASPKTTDDEIERLKMAFPEARIERDDSLATKR